jgi:hypothetical protein
MDPDPDPCLFVIDLKDAKIFIFFFKFLLNTVLFEGTFTSFFKDKKSKRSHKTVKEARFFLQFLLDDRRIRIRIQEA